MIEVRPGLVQVPNGPILPEAIAQLYTSDDCAQEVFERWRSMRLADFGPIPELKTYRAVNGDGIRYVDIIPKGDFDEEHVLNDREPIANGFTPHMYLRALLKLELLDVPQRIRVYPNDTRSVPTTDLHKPSWERVRSGDVRPLAELQQASLDKDPDVPDNAVNDNSGYSFGGVMAIEQSLIAATRSLDFTEIPTLVDRTDNPAQLDRDVLNASYTLKPYNRAILDSRIPALAEAFGVKSEHSTLRQLTIGGLLFLLDTRLKPNADIKAALTHRTADDKLLTLAHNRSDMSVVMANARGRIQPSARSLEIGRKVSDHFANFAYYAMNGYAHEAGDNIWAPALISREARRLAITPQAA